TLGWPRRRRLARFGVAWRELLLQFAEERALAPGPAVAAGAAGAPLRPMRIVAIAAWEFPLFSQSFVCQELAALVAAGFDVRLAATTISAAPPPSPAAEVLAPRVFRLPGEVEICGDDLAHFRRTRGERVERLLSRLAQQSGRRPEELAADGHVQRGFALARAAEAWGADYLHSYFFYEGSLAAMVAQALLALPRGITCYADHEIDDAQKRLVPLHLASADLLVATSERVRRELTARLPEAAPRILVKPNAVDTAFFAPVERRDPAPDEPLRLITVARIDPKKGLADLLAACADLEARGVDFTLEIVGGVEAGSAAGERERAARIAETARLGLVDRVRWRGILDAVGVRAALGGAQLFVLPSVETASGDKDGIPTALLEAMATGLAVVATRAGSIPEAVRDGVDGRLVEAGSPAKLAAAIAGLAGDSAGRRALGAAAALRVRERFSVEVCEPRLAARIARLVADFRGLESTGER
ncbi:MAG: glycosyltransferase family 4 protein, partial [Thermoanaerobaculia bacterium]